MGDDVVITKMTNALVSLFIFLLFYMPKGLLTAVLLADLSDCIFLVCQAIEPLHNLMGKFALDRSLISDSVVKY